MPTINNKAICQLVDAQLEHFFSDIGITLDLLEEEQWDIDGVIGTDRDPLFYYEEYYFSTPEAKERFEAIFARYTAMIIENLRPDNQLIRYLDNWQRIKARNPRAKIRSFLRATLKHKDYQMFSPVFIANMYADRIENIKDRNNLRNSAKKKHMIRAEIEQELDKRLETFDEVLAEFNSYYTIQRKLFLYSPEEDNTIAGKKFICNMMVGIMNLAEQLINLNVYAIHSIISEIINEFTPLFGVIEMDECEFV